MASLLHVRVTCPSTSEGPLNPAQTGTVRVTVVPFRARPVRLRIAGRLLVTNTVNLAVAIGFTAMGVAIIALADQPDMTRGTAAQGWASRQLTTAFLRIQEWASPVPEAVQALLLFLVVGALVAATLTGRRRGATAATPSTTTPRTPDPTPSSSRPSRGTPHTALRSARPTESAEERVAPDFTLPDSVGGSVTPSDLRGSPVLLYVSEGSPCCRS